VKKLCICGCARSQVSVPPGPTAGHTTALETAWLRCSTPTVLRLRVNEPATGLDCIARGGGVALCLCVLYYHAKRGFQDKMILNHSLNICRKKTFQMAAFHSDKVHKIIIKTL